MMALVVFVTTYLLIMPAVSMNRDSAEQEPGLTLSESSESNEQEALNEEDTETIDETGDSSISETEEETEPSPVLSYPAVTFEETIENFVTVKAAAEEGTFPEGTTMILTPVEQEEVIDTVKETVEGTVKHIVAVDITFKDVNGNEIEPLKQINVTMNAPSVEDTTATEVVHIDNEGNGTLVEQEESAEDEVIFNTDSFSVYVIVEKTIETSVITAEGETYRITVTYGPEACIPEGAELKAEEIRNDQEGYEEHVLKTAEAMQTEKEYLADVRLFDISIVSADGTVIEPASNVQVRIEYENNFDAAKQTLHVVHFAEEGTEIIEPEQCKDENGKVEAVEFETDSFSVYGVISHETSQDVQNLDGNSYVLVVSNKNGAVMAEEHSSAGRLASKSFTWINNREMMQVNGSITMWTFEAVPERPGWFYISDGRGHYLNMEASASDRGGTVTLGEKQPLYVASRNSGENVQYQIRTAETGGVALNNYNNNLNDGFGAWVSGNGANEWFAAYEEEYLGEIRVEFDRNNGNGNPPDPVYGISGNSITLPDYTGTRNGYTFIGWSTGRNLANNTYYPLYPAGSEYVIPESNTTLYAVWANNTPPNGTFFIRLDGKIPYEPDQYEPSAYTQGITITGAIREQYWISDNDTTKPNNGLYIENNVTESLNQLPNVNQLVNNINRNSNRLGFQVENRNGEIVVTNITSTSTNNSNYHVSVGDHLYIHWYVQKYAGGWHVDGVLLVKDRVNIAYDGNVTDGSAKNLPMGYQENRGTDVIIGANGSKNGPVRTPTRPGYIFLGWNTMPDGSGDSYSNNDHYTLNEDTVLYAQWSKGKNYMTVSKTNEDDQVLAGAQFILEEKTSTGYVEKANRTTNQSGIFTYDQMENDTLYRMTEIYAPNGYEVRNAFYFKVSTDNPDSTELKLHVCDEEGNYIQEPNWLTIQYSPADDPGSSGVARIQFIIEDKRIQRSIRFVKVNEDGDPLPGAEYTLLDQNGNPVSDVIKASGSDEEGIFSVDGATLPYGTYTLHEDRAPATYSLGEDVQFTLNDYVSEQNHGLRITAGDAAASCAVTEETVEGLTITTYAYTVTVTDTKHPHILVKKEIQADETINLSDINTTIYYALTRKGEHDYVQKDGSIWIESMEIKNGVPDPQTVIFEDVDYGEYDVWEMALIDGEYTRMYGGLVVGNDIQLDRVSAQSADGGNNAVLSESDIEAEVDFTNMYGRIRESTEFLANKRWADRAGNIIDPPEGALVEFTVYSEKEDGSLEKVRSIELDGTADPDGETEAWKADFKYLPLKDENGRDCVYKVKETSFTENFYPNNYPDEYYVTTSGGTITNRKLLTDIELHKTLEVYPADDAAVQAALSQLSFTLADDKGHTYSYTLADFTKSDIDSTDYVLYLEDMPLGSYTFTEEGQESLLDGYELVYSVSSSQASAETGGTEQPVLSTLKLENIYAKKGSLTVKKNSVTVTAKDGSPAPEEITSKAFTFIVKRGDLYLQEDGTLGTEPYEFALQEHETKEFNDIPAGEYTVIEKDASVEEYAWTVTDGTQNGTDSEKSVTVPADESAESLFDNEYTKLEKGDLDITKTVTGGPDEASDKEYLVEVTTVKDEATLWLNAEGKLTTEQTKLPVSQQNPLHLTGVPAGTYIVSEDETDAAFEEYSLEVTYTESNEVTIVDKETSSVSIQNTYTYLYTPVIVTKTVTGNMGDKELGFGFEAAVLDENGQPMVIEDITDAEGLIKFNLKDGTWREIEKLPKGARLQILEHNLTYTTSVDGYTGLDREDRTNPVTGSAFEETDTTAVYTFTIPDDGAVIHFTNDYNITVPVILKKAGYDNRDHSMWDLQGAVFRIYTDENKAEGSLVTLDGKTEFTSDENGILYTGELGLGTYYLDEVTTPDGYNSPAGMYRLVIAQDNVTLYSTAVSGNSDLNEWITAEPQGEDGAAVYTVCIRNTTGYELPHTGGIGTGIFRTAGLALMLGAALILSKRIRG